MDITLPLIRLRHKQVRYVAADVVLIRHRVASEYLL